MGIPHSLEQILAEGKVVPFVGAGVSMSVLGRATGRPLFPSWRELLERAAARLEGERDKRKASRAGVIRGLLGLGEAGDYLEAAKHAREGLGASWYGFLKTQLNPPRESADDQSLETARAVWELGSRLVITTNFDRVLHWACPRPEDLSYWNIEAPAEQIGALRLPAQRPVVWHLHGFIDKATDIILTPGGYDLLYPTRDGAEGKYRAALAALRAYLITHTFLFVGFSLDDAHLVRQLAEAHEIFEGAPGPHYALVHAAEEARVRALGLPVELVAFEDFGPPLVKLLREMGAAAAAARDAGGVDEGAAAGETVTAAPPAYGPHNTPFSVPFAPKGEHFVGREELLRAVHEQLTRGTRTGLGRTAALLGLGGLGKTQLAVEYAFRHKDDYPGGVVWLTADQDLDAQLVELAARARWVAPEVEHKFKLEVARQRVRSHPDCLIIFDNLETLDAVRGYLPAEGVESYLLVTSRAEQPDFISVQLDPLDEALSLRLLTQEAKHEPSGEAERRAADEIVGALGGLPLALEMAGAYLRNRPVGWAQYRDLLRHDFKSAVPYKFFGGGGTRHDADLYATLRMSEEAVAGEPLLVEVLDVLTWSGTAPMGYPLLRALLGEPDIGPLTDALGLGCALRLLQKTPGAESYAIHRLVRQERHARTSLADRPEWVDAVCQRVGQWFDKDSDEFITMRLLEAEVDHLTAWHGHASNHAPRHVCRLTWLQSYPPKFRADFKESKRILEQSLQFFEEGQTEDRELEAQVLDEMSNIEKELGHYPSALENAKKALAIKQGLYGEDAGEVAKTLFRIGGIYLVQAQYRHALSYTEKALPILSRHYGEQSRYAGLALGNIALSLENLGHNDEARETYEKSLAINRAVSGDRHLDMSILINNLGQLYTKIGEAGKGLEYALESLEIMRERGMESHPDTGMVMNTIGICYRALGEHELAREYLGKCLELEKQYLGREHPDTVMVAQNLAQVLYLQGHRVEALDLLKEYLGRLPKDHPYYARVRQEINNFLRQPVRPGFRQSSKKNKRGKKR
jgi:tetratricopeptide (TPR) repeat protein